MDIYDDLDEFDLKVQYEKLREMYKDLESENLELIEKNNKLTKENKELDKQNKIIKNNFESFHAAAISEITKKNKKIRQLRRSKDQLIFRKNIKKQNNNTYLNQNNLQFNNTYQNDTQIIQTFNQSDSDGYEETTSLENPVNKSNIYYQRQVNKLNENKIRNFSGTTSSSTITHQALKSNEIKENITELKCVSAQLNLNRQNEINKIEIQNDQNFVKQTSEGKNENHNNLKEKSNESNKQDKQIFEQMSKNRTPPLHRSRERRRSKERDKKSYHRYRRSISRENWNSVERKNYDKKRMYYSKEDGNQIRNKLNDINTRRKERSHSKESYHSEEMKRYGKKIYHSKEGRNQIRNRSNDRDSRESYDIKKEKYDKKRHYSREDKSKIRNKSTDRSSRMKKRYQHKERARSREKKYLKDVVNDTGNISKRKRSSSCELFTNYSTNLNDFELKKEIVTNPISDACDENEEFYKIDDTFKPSRFKKKKTINAKNVPNFDEQKCDNFEKYDEKYHNYNNKSKNYELILKTKIPQELDNLDVVLGNSLTTYKSKLPCSKGDSKNVEMKNSEVEETNNQTFKVVKENSDLNEDNNLTTYNSKLSCSENANDVKIDEKKTNEKCKINEINEKKINKMFEVAKEKRDLNEDYNLTTYKSKFLHSEENDVKIESNDKVKINEKFKINKVKETNFNETFEVVKENSDLNKNTELIKNNEVRKFSKENKIELLASEITLNVDNEEILILSDDSEETKSSNVEDNIENKSEPKICLSVLDERNCSKDSENCEKLSENELNKKVYFLKDSNECKLIENETKNELNFENNLNSDESANDSIITIENDISKQEQYFSSSNNEFVEMKLNKDEKKNFKVEILQIKTKKSACENLVSTNVNNIVQTLSESNQKSLNLSEDLEDQLFLSDDDETDSQRLTIDENKNVQDHVANQKNISKELFQNEKFDPKTNESLNCGQIEFLTTGEEAMRQFNNSDDLKIKDNLIEIIDEDFNEKIDMEFENTEIVISKKSVSELKNDNSDNVVDIINEDSNHFVNNENLSENKILEKTNEKIIEIDLLPCTQLSNQSNSSTPFKSSQISKLISDSQLGEIKSMIKNKKLNLNNKTEEHHLNQSTQNQLAQQETHLENNIVENSNNEPKAHDSNRGQSAQGQVLQAQQKTYLENYIVEISSSNDEELDQNSDDINNVKYKLIKLDAIDRPKVQHGKDKTLYKNYGLDESDKILENFSDNCFDEKTNDSSFENLNASSKILEKNVFIEKIKNDFETNEKQMIDDQIFKELVSVDLEGVISEGNDCSNNYKQIYKTDADLLRVLEDDFHVDENNPNVKKPYNLRKSPKKNQKFDDNLKDTKNKLNESETFMEVSEGLNKHVENKKSNEKNLIILQNYNTIYKIQKNDNNKIVCRIKRKSKQRLTI